ncbi:protein FAM240A [Acipenser oxyrinchus oxyrinchus]|uniref:Protein FAM240A n=1 Tax=Acipenser oxyrinchus oxyrinchus TaxID=40147 RepID=A0AAD8GL62_ACIOX|nr:protein FAM240A [Acipenser oxyrinchus oxyrinchus]
MNTNMSRRAVLVHDKDLIKNFWEQKIGSQYQVTESEDVRMKKSALKKLRNEWVEQLESRTKHLKKFNEDRHKQMQASLLTTEPTLCKAESAA